MFARFRAYSPALLVVFAMGCFTYADAPSVAVLQPGSDLRVTLTPDGRVGLASKVGPQVRYVSGRVRDADSSGLQLAVRSVTLIDGTEAQWTGETTRIPASYIDHANVKTVSKGKTAVLLAMIAGAAVALTLSLSHGSSSNGNTVPGSPGQ